MFPTLSPEDVQRLRRFGTVRRYAAGETLVTTGQISAGMSVLLSGSVAVSGREGLSHVVPIVELGPGGFLAEAGQLAGRPALVDARAIGDVETLLIPTDRLRTVLIAEAELGERIMRALLLRRTGLIETGAGGPVPIGPAVSPDLVRLQGFLARNASPHRVLDPADDPEAAALLDRYASRPTELPLVVCPDGSLLENPTEADLARPENGLAAETRVEPREDSNPSPPDWRSVPRPPMNPAGRGFECRLAAVRQPGNQNSHHRA